MGRLLSRCVLLLAVIASVDLIGGVMLPGNPEGIAGSVRRSVQNLQGTAVKYTGAGEDNNPEHRGRVYNDPHQPVKRLARISPKDLAVLFDNFHRAQARTRLAQDYGLDCRCESTL